MKKEYTQSEIARMYNRKRQQISQWVKEGKLLLNDNKKIDLEHAEQFFKVIDSLSNKKEQDSNKDKTKASVDEDATLNQILMYKNKVEALSKEVDLQKKRNELIDKQEVLQEVNMIASNLKESLLTIPNRVSPLLAIESDEKKIFNLLNKEIRQTLDNVIKSLEKLKNKKNKDE